LSHFRHLLKTFSLGQWDHSAVSLFNCT